MSFYANKLFPWVLDVTEPKEMAEQRRLILHDVRFNASSCCAAGQCNGTNN